MTLEALSVVSVVWLISVGVVEVISEELTHCQGARSQAKESEDSQHIWYLGIVLEAGKFFKLITSMESLGPFILESIDRMNDFYPTSTMRAYGHRAG